MAIFFAPLIFLKKNSDPLIFLLFFLDPLNFRHEIPSFQTPYFTIEKNFTPLISQAWKNSHPLFYIASTKNFAPLILHGKNHPLFLSKWHFRHWFFKNLWRDLTWSCSCCASVLSRLTPTFLCAFSKLNLYSASKIYTSQSFMLSTEYSSSTSQLDLSENWVRHDQAITGDEHRRDEFGLNNNFI